MMRGETVILAAGDFPKRGGEAWRLLEAAKNVVCCDGAADAYRRRFRKEPTVVVGDCDSVRGKFSAVVKVPEQMTNDLEKAIRLCYARRWSSPVILGATGKREDHTIGNVYRAIYAGLEMVTDYGRFVPIAGRIMLKVRKGTAISVFTLNEATHVTSEGLEWPLKGDKLFHPYSGTLNRATGTKVLITATGLASAFVAF